MYSLSLCLLGSQSLVIKHLIRHEFILFFSDINWGYKSRYWKKHESNLITLTTKNILQMNSKLFLLAIISSSKHDISMEGEGGRGVREGILTECSLKQRRCYASCPGPSCDRWSAVWSGEHCDNLSRWLSWMSRYDSQLCVLIVYRCDACNSYCQSH